MNNASGAAALLALAHRFAAQDAPSLDHGLIFLFPDTRAREPHATTQLLEQYPVLARAIDLDIALGNIGLDCEEKRHGLACTDHPAPRLALTDNLPAPAADALQAALRQHHTGRTALLSRDAFRNATGLDPDYETAPGIPSIALTAYPPYIHSPEDTPDKVAAAALEPTAATLADLILALDG